MIDESKTEPKTGELIPAQEASKFLTERPALARRPGNIFIGTVNIFTTPSRLLKQTMEKQFSRRYAGKYRHARLLFFIDLALLGMIVALTALAAWVFFFRSTLADQIALSVKLDRPELVSGERVTFTFFYEHTGREPFKDADLTIRLPAFFELKDSFPEFDSRRQSIFIGDLAPGFRGQAKVSGIFWGEVGSSVSLYSSLSFRSEDDKREAAFHRQDFLINRSTLQLTAEAPDRLVAGQAITITLRYAQNGSLPFPDVRITPIWPDGFRFISSEPALKDGHWQLGELASEARGAISISGFLPQKPSPIVFRFIPLVRLQEQTLSQGTTALEGNMIPQPLSVEASVEGFKDGVLAPGDSVTIHLSYANQSSLPLEDVFFGAELESPLAGINSFFFQPEKGSPPDRLEPGETGRLSQTFSLISQPSKRDPQFANRLALMVKPFARYTLTDGLPLRLETQGPELRLLIRTPFEASVSGRYWTTQNEQIGRGPLPPMAGETTKYWIFWQLAPTWNDLEHLEFRARLPANVTFGARSNVTVGSPLIWNPADRTISWTIDQLEATVASGQIVSGRFEVALTPSADQINTAPALVGETAVSGRDKSTGTDLQATLPGLTTAISGDPRASAKAVVKAP
ncbi:hypothetical protein HY628_02390 [Candidatus Uhrbacteria bacterium]|nr:hypothetical protein [Candidatus Uhrbacteria bacterium]